LGQNHSHNIKVEAVTMIK